jgi:hypothetical protein
VIRQTRKLVDVIAISQHTDIGQTIFNGLSAELFATDVEATV